MHDGTGEEHDRQRPQREPEQGALVGALRGQGAMQPFVDALLAAPDVSSALVTFGDVVLDAVLDPSVVQMRRLVAAQSDRFPGVATAYLRTSWDANVDALAEALADLNHRGSLKIDESRTAAAQLVWLLVGGPLNAQTLTGGLAAPSSPERHEFAIQAVRTFLARYGPESSAS